MAGLRRPIFLAAALAAVMTLPATGSADDNSVSIADAPGGNRGASTWTTPPPGGRAARSVRTPPRTRTRRATPGRVPTPRWIEVPAQPQPATPAPVVTEANGEAAPVVTEANGETAPARADQVILDGQLVDRSVIDQPADAPIVDRPTPVAGAPAAATPAIPARPNGRVGNARNGRRARTARAPVQFRFAVGDEILISIWDDDVESGTIDLRQRILRDGTISPLWLDPIRVQGRTIAEIRGELVEAYKEYYKIPRITVGVESVHKERAFVLGEVLEPAAIELNGPQTLMQVLAQAGGIEPTFGDKTVRILRSRGPGCRPRIFTVNTERTLCGRARSFMVMPGDVVYVHPNGLAGWSRNLTAALQPLQALFGAAGGAAAVYLAFNQDSN